MFNAPKPPKVYPSQQQQQQQQQQQKKKQSDAFPPPFVPFKTNNFPFPPVR